MGEHVELLLDVVTPLRAGSAEREVNGVLDSAGAEFTLGVVEGVLININEMFRHAVQYI